MCCVTSAIAVQHSASLCKQQKQPQMCMCRKSAARLQKALHMRPKGRSRLHQLFAVRKGQAHVSAPA